MARPKVVAARGRASRKARGGGSLQVVALTGTPGTGKTTLGRELRRRGYAVLSLNRLAKSFAVAYDKARRSAVVDERRLAAHVASHLDALHRRALAAAEPPRKASPFFVEGHLAHHLPFADRVVVLRLDPRELERRLRRRYSQKKARENAEAEAIGVIAGECRRSRRATELDLTALSREQAADRVLRAASARAPPRIGRVDWSEAILSW